MPWWGYTALGLGLMAFAMLLYAGRDSPNVRIEGGSPRVVTAVFVVIGFVVMLLGILGYFMPNVLRWMKIYSNTAESLSSIGVVVTFLGLQVLLIFGIFYALFTRATDLLPGLMILTVLSGLYWAWVFWTGKFEQGYIAPFKYVYKLFLG
jgi:hypothetical protein